LSKKRSGIQTFFSTTTYAEIPQLGVFKPGAVPLDFPGYSGKIQATRSACGR
jgi:hypothetical protein